MATNIVNKVLPVNKTDAITLMHDVDYMIAQTKEEALVADLKAVAQTPYDLPGILTKIGLTVRSLYLPNNFYGGNPQVGKELKHIVKTHPFWQNIFSKLNLTTELEKW